MKGKILLWIILLLMIGLSGIRTNAQSSSNNNAGFGQPNSYLGWDIATPQPLYIRHEAPLPINFYTNSGVMPLLNNQRMTIFDAAGAGNAGFVGIGDFILAGTTPQSHLHLMNQPAADNWFQITTAGTGHASANGLRIGVIDATGDVEINQQQNADMTLPPFIVSAPSRDYEAIKEKTFQIINHQ